VWPTATVPEAPLNPAITGTAHEALVTFDSPVSDDRFPITGFEYSLDHGQTWKPTQDQTLESPVKITGLLPITTYEIAVRAVNEVGAGLASNVLEFTTATSPPSSPSITSVVTGNACVTFGIIPPAQLGDVSLAGYDYSLDDGVTWSQFASVDGPFTITGLANGTAYQVRVRAVNSAGVGRTSEAVTMNPTSLIPAMPAILSVTRGNGQATVYVKAPTDVTSQSITGYQFNLNNGPVWSAVTLTDGSFTATGLTNGTNYVFKIRAVNDNGVSVVSAKAAVTPMTTGTAPNIQSIKSINGGLAVTFGAPTNNGGGLRNYQYSIDGGTTWKDCVPALKLGPTLTIKGLTNGTTYQVAIRMVNAVGPSASSNVMFGTAMSTPGAPAITSVVVGKTTIKFTLGTTASGGSPIIGYAYSLDNRTWMSFALVDNQFTIASLKTGVTYRFYVRASNVAGNGASASTIIKTIK